MKKYKLSRVLIYLMGLFVLALGISLSSKTGLGVAPVVSVAYVFSSIYKIDLGITTFSLYLIFVLIQMSFHVLRYDKKNIGIDLLQFLISILFGLFITCCSNFIPNLDPQSTNLYISIFFLMIAIFCTGTGAILSIRMKIIPNPADGIVMLLSEITHKNIGLIKNLFDLFQLSLACLVSYFLIGQIIGVGIGTILAVIGVGRSMALINMVFGNKLDAIVKK